VLVPKRSKTDVRVEVGRGDTGDDVSWLGVRRLRLSSVRKSIHSRCTTASGLLGVNFS